MFKNMSIIFTCTEDPSFKKGKISFNREGFKFKVERYISGAFNYGDHSGHSVKVLDHSDFATKYFDTRYQGISTEKKEWIKIWKDYLERELLLKVEADLDSYTEEVINND